MSKDLLLFFPFLLEGWGSSIRPSCLGGCRAFLDSRDNKAEFAGQMNLLMRKEGQQLGWGGAGCVRVSVSVGEVGEWGSASEEIRQHKF